jgi:hypothetical protein
MSSYPLAAVEQLLLVLATGRAERRLRERLVLVWMNGGWARPDTIRDALTELLDRASAPIRDALRKAGDSGAAADMLARDVGPGTTRAWRLVRKRMASPKEVREAMWVLADLALGGEPIWAPSEGGSRDGAEAVMTRALGLDHAKEDRLGEQEPWMPDDQTARAALERVRAAGGLDLVDLARVIREASHAELEQARDDLTNLWQALSLLGGAAEARYGEDVAGLGMLRAMALVQTDATVCAFAVRNALLLRTLGAPEAFEELQRLAAELMTDSDKTDR